MGLESHWEAHCDKCASWTWLPGRKGTPAGIAKNMGWRKFGTKWMCPSCHKNVQVAQKVEQLASPTTSPNGLTYGCQACWDDINGDAHEAHCHRSRQPNVLSSSSRSPRAGVR